MRAAELSAAEALDAKDELAGVAAALDAQACQLREHLASHPGDAEAAELLEDVQQALQETQAACAELAAGGEGGEVAGAAAAVGGSDGLRRAGDQDDEQHRAPGVQPQQQPQQQQPQQPQQPQQQQQQQPQQQQPANAGRTMHPANLYAAGEPDFAALAAAHPPLAPHLQWPAGGGGAAAATTAKRPSLDFTSWAATKELTAALLRADFGLTWDLPAGQLVPPVPNRANYIHWLADLLALSSPPGAAGGGRAVRGLDIGCGANLVYCLLGAAIHGWAMTGVDVTDVALHAAAALVAANPHLAPLLEVRRSRCQVAGPEQRQLGPLLGAVQPGERFAFSMCNPPFFNSLAEANQNPNTACGGTAEEMVCPGGELAFIRAMIADSRQLGPAIHWYTSMCGKKASLKVLRQELHAAGVTALRTTELVQGRTSRWAVAWSFAVSPSTANMPLPRQGAGGQQQQQQQQGQQAQQAQGQVAAAAAAGHAKAGTKRQLQQEQQNSTPLAFMVSAGAGEGRKLLQVLAALLGSVGGAQGVKVDAAQWKVLGTLPGGQQQQQHAAAAQRASPVKQPRLAAAAAGSSDDAEELCIQLAVYQQRKGFQVVAAAVSGAPAAGGGGGARASSRSDGRLLAVVEAVTENLALMWPVKGG